MKQLNERGIIEFFRRNAGQIAPYLKPFFASGSSFQAPMADVAQTGNRAVAVMRDSFISDSAILPMQNGVCEWPFSSKFTKAPIVTVTPQGPYAGAGATVEIFIDHDAPPTTAKAIIRSSQADDNRLLHLSAAQLPD